MVRAEQLIAVSEAGLNKDHTDVWYLKWIRLRNSSKRRGLSCHLSFAQYLKKAVSAGIKNPDEIGIRKHQYNLGRFGDKGNYTKANCRFITVVQNRRESCLNGGTQASSTKQKGRSAETHSYIANRADALSGRTKQTHEYLNRSAVKRSKSFKVKSPSGVYYRGINLNEFCTANDLTMSAMSRVCMGKAAHHKGWTGKYLKV
jgi:hypothetical protein